MNRVSGKTRQRFSKLLIASAALAAFGASAAQAATQQSWTTTRTKAFLPLVQTASAAAASLTQAAGATRATQPIPLANGAAVHVTVGLKLRNEAQLDQFLAKLQQGSAGTLTPQQFAERYGPTQQQADAVAQYLRASGFTNVQIAPNRLFVTADGTAGTVKQGFNTTLEQFTTGTGRRVFANAEDAQVPSALGNVVDTVLGLQNVVVAHTFHHVLPVGEAAPARAAAAGTATGHNPVQFSSIYDAGSTPTAANTTVGIITYGNQAQTVSDLNTFASRNGLAPVSSSIVNTGGSGRTYSSGDIEWQLDSQSIVGAAGGAVQQVIFYNAPDDAQTNQALLDDISNAFNRAVTDNKAKVINVSLGWCESDADGTSIRAADDNIFKQAVAQGQTFSVSSGDEGAYECSTSRVSGVGGVPNTTHYSVSAPASSPYVIAVGGTTLYTSGNKWANETVWNEGLRAIGYYDSEGDYDSTKRLWATGGGYSTVEAAPSWQSASVTGSSSARALPDIAFDAASSTGAILYYNGSTTDSDGNPNQVGGTSLASPIFVGIWARLQSANGNALGFPAASIYRYFPSNPSLVHDVTSGNNGSGSYKGFAAAAGWDGSTGFGSIDISQLNAFIKSHSDFAR
ncbi:peptidase S53 [Burkholderia glumae]|uniref:S53 family peptidase n=1 Tax=Burkholderia glumae TaxID=337 RepID=UPI000C280244|nr:S53 family peptidase [Burkholderia glumae]MCQ0029950.1 S53 family peptidase [Burkholderia glumae]MCQ0039066.1 S53 family peptidase [Burkholderia glumae]PJO21366.1 peptidase S53 [Burkholderia glumae AU6208]QHE13362.1 peptidase S53 [Burkholderia glumae AU6208]QJW81976.1 S8/S53 family peptidase [Burkholderia glumae]